MRMGRQMTMERVDSPPRIPPEGAAFRILKYVLGHKATRKAFAVEMPVNAQVLAIGHKAHGACIWAMGCSEPEWPTESRFFTLLPTGEDLPFPARRLHHIGSFWKEDRPETWHIFEIIDPVQEEDPLVAEALATVTGR